MDQLLGVPDSLTVVSMVHLELLCQGLNLLVYLVDFIQLAELILYKILGRILELVINVLKGELISDQII